MSKIAFVENQGNGAINHVEAFLNKIQTFDLLTGYNTELRIKVNRRWAELEAKEQTKLPKTFSEALQLAADQAKQLELQAPKVESYDKFIDSEALQGFKEVANLLGLGRNTMMKKLRELKITTRSNIPYQQYLNMGLFEVKESTQNGFSLATTYVTPKGIEYIKNKLNKDYNEIK